MKYCRLCLQPDTRPSIVFGEDGVCPACRFAQEAPQVDWEQRRQEIEEIARWGKKHNISGYDCIIGVSGGKDSTRLALFAKEELGLNPLLVCCQYPPEQVTERGAYNLANLIELGFDTITVSPAPEIWKKLLKNGFLKYGNWSKSTEMALYASAPKVAIAYQIPLVFLGENPAVTVGDLGTGSTDGDANRMKYCHTLASGPEELMEPGMTNQDILWYSYNSDEEIKMGDLRIVYLGFYIPGFAKRSNAEFSRARGMLIRTDPPEELGCLTGEEALDEDFDIIGQMLKFFKFGFGKVNDEVNEEIRLGTMTREQGLELVRRYDGAAGDYYVDIFCDYLGWTRERFWKVADSFRDPAIWEKTERDGWRLKYPPE